MIIFDFGGVIVDSFSLALKINKKTIPNLTAKSYRQKFKGNINDKMKKYNKAAGIEEEFFEEYGPCLNLRKLVPGIKEVILTLSRKYLLAIVSSTTTEVIQKYLFCHRLEHCFADILGNDVDHSKVEKFKMIFKKYNVSPEKCIFITDTLGDVREASEVFLPTLAVTWGFHDQKTLENGNIITLVYGPEELLQRIEEYFGRK